MTKWNGCSLLLIVTLLWQTITRPINPDVPACDQYTKTVDSRFCNADVTLNRLPSSTFLQAAALISAQRSNRFIARPKLLPGLLQ